MGISIFFHYFPISYVIQWEFYIFHFSSIFSYNSMGISYFFHYFSISYVIQFYIFFSFSCQFPMLFNGSFCISSIFINFSYHWMGIHSFYIITQCPMLFNGNSAFFFIFLLIFHIIQWGLHIFFIFCQFSMLFNRNYWNFSCPMVQWNPIGQSPCVLLDIIPFGAAAMIIITYIDKHTKQGNGYGWLHIALGQLVFPLVLYRSM